MIRRRLSVALVAAASTTLALVTPAHADTQMESEPSFSSLSSGSSGDSDDENSELPGWAQSMVLDEDSLLVLEIIRAVMATGLAITQGAVLALPFIPGGKDQLRDFLASLGIQP
ncbi:hypothetical protein [Corynebacterium comes]|uniref:Secreted protein n=1 Tax=Corynebacterium comes TaxID=2675218 RepID=A0A6B8VXU5_9CORY|nr:hypothetical protein [Corynebacterium comes]QGU04981.1 hypothetical protein CETAM_08635 [Corynebacterium comes]